MSSIDHENPHHTLIQHRLPAWSQQASPAHWQTLHDTFVPAQGLPGAEADWFANAAPALRDAVLASQARLRRSQQALARALNGLKNIAEFAEPLLAQALLAEYQLSAPTRSTELIHIRRRFTWQTYVSQHERRSLLEAALHNFEDGAEFSSESALALAGDAQVTKTVVTGKTTLGDSETLVDIELASESYQIKALNLSPADFAQSCRALDLGRRYQEHLSAIFAPAHIATLAGAVDQDRLRLAADLAFLRHQLSGQALDSIQALLAGDATLPCKQLSLFGITLHEALIVDLEDVGLLLYLPGHILALRQFETLPALHDQLRDDLLQADFRQRFCAYVPNEQQGDFLSRLRQNLDADGNSPSAQTWPLRESADLHLAQVNIEQELFSFLHQDHLTRLKAEARQLAVPTADADEQARRRRREQWQSLGLDALMLAGFFVPGVGTLMTAVMAYQLLDEVYEGYQAWSVGDHELAFHHLKVVGLNLALIAGLHIAGSVASNLFNSPLMESLDAVVRPDGSQRLWRPDLEPYRSPVQLPQSLEANPMGQYPFQGRHYIRIENQYYEQRLDAEAHRWRVVHPADHKAYQPPLEHNSDGAWRAEHEQPQAWPVATLVRRLDASLQDLDDQQVQQALDICGVNESALRYTHLTNTRTAPLLTDTLKRMTVEKQLMQQLASAPDLEPAAVFEQLYNGPQAASPAQANLIARYPRLTLPLARQILAPLSPGELLMWEDDAPLPTWIARAAEQVSSDLPMTRAVEGLSLPRLTGSDSERLALLTLERLWGESTDLHLALRAGSPEGTVLATAGSSSAAQRRVIVKSDQGYEAFIADTPRPGLITEDLCTAIVRALPAALRQEMGLEQLSGDVLRARLLEQINSQRQYWSRRLYTPAPGWSKSTALRGGRPLDPSQVYAPAAALRNTNPARYRRLFPNASEQDIRQILIQWQRQGRFASVELQALEDRLHALRSDLHDWAGEVPRRQRAIGSLINAWRRTSVQVTGAGTRLSLLDLGALELENEDLLELALPNSFTHVQVIDLSGNRLLSQLPAEFLERFPQLRCLYLRHCRFATIPRIANPLTLTWLDLEANRITWDAQAQTAMDRLYGLNMLDLSDNPLLTSPDFHAMHGLGTVHLANCSLTQLPQGLQAMERPMLIDLEDNQFTALPQDFDLPPEHARVLRLESDALSNDLMQQINGYYQQTGIDLLLADSDYDDLLQDITAEQRTLWDGLPLDYRRNLRLLLLDDDYIADPQQAHHAIWERLQRMAQDPDYLQRAEAVGAEHLLRLPL